jgi:hypothetical protein
MKSIFSDKLPGANGQGKPLPSLIGLLCHRLSLGIRVAVPRAVVRTFAVFSRNVNGRNRIVDPVDLRMKGQFDEKGRFRDSTQAAVSTVANSRSGFADIRQKIATQLFHEPTGSPL